MGEESAPPDRNLARLAARQHGVASRRQLELAGLGRKAIANRVEKGQLFRIHRGVYAVGHAGLSLEARWMAAVLACGPGAVLSHASAAALWDLLRAERGAIDISVPSHYGRCRRVGIRVHRCASLAPRPKAAVGFDGYAAQTEPPEIEARHTLVTVRRKIPVTTVARTVHDLEAVAEPHLVRRAIRQAQLARYALDARTRTDRTRSDLEGDFLRLCRRHGVPEPQVNVRVGRWTVDFLWPRRRLAVETDGERWHRGSVSLEDDHRRDLDLRAAGYRVRRYSGAQIEAEPKRIVEDLRRALAPRASSSS